MAGLKRGQRSAATEFYPALRRELERRRPGFVPRPALFGCSDEVNSAADAARHDALGREGGIFTTRLIGSQVIYHQLAVAVSRGHRSNCFEVNVHLGERARDGRLVHGELTGRDGETRACCGALAHVLADFRTAPAAAPSVSQVVNGETVLDFLGTIKFRLNPFRDEILADPEPMPAITRRNLTVQVGELVRHLRTLAAADPDLLPAFVIGTIAWNRDAGDEESLESFLLLTGPGAEPLDLWRE